MRFSYGDFVLFKRILKSLPQQINSAVNQNNASLNTNPHQGTATVSDSDISTQGGCDSSISGSQLYPLPVLSERSLRLCMGVYAF